MKHIVCALAMSVLVCGCVASPEEVAKSETNNPSTDSVANAANSSSDSTETGMPAEESPTEEVVTASAEEDGAPDQPAFKKTNNGLKYRILREGTGETPTETSTVVCNYRGWLDNGREFDSSYKRGQPAEFSLAQVIPGWTEGLQLVKEGGKIELEVPSRLGYGEQGTPGIPPNSRLHFEVELIDVK